MKRVKFIKYLIVPILLGVLLGSSGCYCMWPFGRDHHHDNDGGYRDGGDRDRGGAGHDHKGGRY